jgi:hypothetical protein
MTDDQLPQPWKIGEHIAAVGDTGTGKSYLISKLVDLRRYVVFIRTKPDDIKFPGFVKARKASAMDRMYDTRILLTPQHSYQMRETYGALERAWEQGGWTVVVDEGWYVEKILRLGALVERLLTQGRSKKISVVVGMQRPAQISRFVISQCTHLFTFRVEGRDLQIIKESTSPRMVEPISNLTGHNFVYYHRAQRVVATGNANSLERIISGTSQNHAPK